MPATPPSDQRTVSASTKVVSKRAGRAQEGQKQAPKSTASDRTVKQLLGELFADRQYLEVHDMTYSCR